MELIVGTNCYTDIEQANELIREYMLSTNPIRVMWESLQDNDKKTIILNTTMKYDNDAILYKGRKQSKDQSLQFPRIENCSDVVECPDRIKIGLLIQGIKELIAEQSESGDFSILQSSGVKSFADGSGARIEFASANEMVGNNNVRNELGLYNSVFKTYFKQYTLYV